MRRPAALFPIALALGAIIIVRGASAQAAAARYTFTTIDVPFPGVGETTAIGINNRHQIVGFYVDGTGLHGFIDDEGRFSPCRRSFPWCHWNRARWDQRSGPDRWVINNQWRSRTWFS